jgi:CO/xanthine dehydrogenase FAD-binding subunit
MNATAVRWLKPSSSAEAVEWLAQNPSATRAVAGCTALTPAAIADDAFLEAVVDLFAAEDMAGIEATESNLDLGATVTATQLARDQNVALAAPALARAARSLGDEIVATTVTLGGNLALRRPGTWELAAPVVAHNSVLVVRQPDGVHELSADVLTDPYFSLAPDELIVRVKLTARRASTYQRMTTNLRSVPAAGVATTTDGETFRVVAVFGIGRPQRLPRLEEALSTGSESRAAAVVEAVKDLPISDSPIASASYHAVAVRTLLEDLFLNPSPDAPVH